MRGSEAVPLFCLLPTGTDEQGVCAEVEMVAREQWPYCVADARRLLIDPLRVADIVDVVAGAVSAALAENPQVGRCLTGYFIQSFRRQLRYEARREKRILCVGLGQELEWRWRCGLDDSARRLEERIFIRQAFRRASPEVKAILEERMMDSSWEEIARDRGLTVNQVKCRFHRGLNEASKRLMESRGKRRKDA